MVGRTPATRWLERLVKARYLRIIPVEFRHTFYLRVEVLGCRAGRTSSCVFTSVYIKDYFSFCHEIEHEFKVSVHKRPFS